MDPNLRPVYGWAMTFGKGYATRPYFNRPSAFVLPRPGRLNHVDTEGRYSADPPFYRLGPAPRQNCPRYNYTLPDTYPVVPTPTVDPREYWFLPYDTYDWPAYESNETVVVPKPS